MNGLPSFTLYPLTEAHGSAICSWRYEPPYDVYNFPSWETMLERREQFADPVIRDEQFAAVLAAGEATAGLEVPELAGFAQFFPLIGVTRIGLGLHPALRGRGWGEAFVRAIADEAKRRQPDHDIDLEVAVWNERARRVYERAGFVVTDRYVVQTPSGVNEVYCMVYEP
ncbi:MAG: GNAT family N-acetyltransferase [Paenibacillaceae bacterium]|nr:GNAT family N-acetyltransferase [Paenibacillaceae bacterium]